MSLKYPMSKGNTCITAKPRGITQAFIQVLLSTPVFPPRFSFFTVCLVQWFRVVAPWYFPRIFLEILEFHGEF